jgi:signal peptidase II
MGIQAGSNKYIRLAIISGLVVVVDQLTKALILKLLPVYRFPGDGITVISGFFSIIHVRNQGGAFGFMADQSPSVRAVLFFFVSFAAICMVFYFYKNTPRQQPVLAVGFALIFGGAIGNMIDRIRFRNVIDFLDIYIGDLHWPTFNIADSAITIGVVIFIFHLLFRNPLE